MFKNKLVNIMLVILITLTLIGVVVIVLVNYLTKEEDPNREPTIDEIVALSFDTPEMTANLASDHFAKVQFRIQVDNKDAFEEVQKRDFQIENIIIREMANLKASDLAGSEGIENLENQLKFKINELMQKGMVVQVYTRRMIIQ